MYWRLNGIIFTDSFALEVQQSLLKVGHRFGEVTKTDLATPVEISEILDEGERRPAQGCTVGGSSLNPEIHRARKLAKS